MAAVTGTGDLIGPVALLSGMGKQPIVGTGALNLPASLVSATSVRGIAGTGALSTPAISLAVAVLRGYLAQGALTAPSISIAATTSVPDPTIWETDNQSWGEADFVYADNKPVMIIGNTFYQADRDLRFGETPIRVRLVRSGLTVMGRDRFGNWKADPRSMKIPQILWPIIRGTPGDVVQIYVGSQEATDDPILWDGPFNFVIGSTKFCDFNAFAGRYLAVRFESLDADPWELLSYDLEIELVGERG